MKMEYRHIFKLQDRTQRELFVHVCFDKREVQEKVKDYLGFLPCNCTNCCWQDETGMVHVAIQRYISVEKLAHEAFHVTHMLLADSGLNPNDYDLIKPDSTDFGYISAEVYADLHQQIVTALIADVWLWVRKEKK